MTQEPRKVPRSMVELFAYASRMERDSAHRYSQLAEMMTTYNNPDLAELFRRMAEIEWLHVYNVSALCRELQVEENAGPAGTGARASGGNGEIPDFEDMHYLHRPYHALALARVYEERAMRFYRDLAREAEDEGIRTAALHLAAEEDAHMQELDSWLSRYPQPEPGWDDDPDPPAEQE